ncbi:hypothetical protein PanWU01x14_052690, partial [Parasponia andersonii]
MTVTTRSKNDRDNETNPTALLTSRNDFRRMSYRRKSKWWPKLSNALFSGEGQQFTTLL